MPLTLAVWVIIEFHRKITTSNTNIHHILLSQRRVLAVLGLEEDGAGGEGFEAVPLAGGDVEDGDAGVHVNDFGEVAGVVVEVFFEVATNADDGFV